MAAPVIDSVEPSAVTLASGESASVMVVAHDPDQGSPGQTFTGTAVIPVSDQGGATAEATVAITVSLSGEPGDSLTFGEATVEGSVPVTVTRLSTTATSAVYRITAT